MAIFRTSQGRPVTHCHIPDPPCKRQELSPARVEVLRSRLRARHPRADEVGPPTRQYNCHGHALAASHGWFEEPALFFADDHFRVSFNNPGVGDVVLYYNDGVLMHTAVVTRVRNGRIHKLRSKWGASAEVSHTLFDVPEVYGEPERLLRRSPSAEPFDLLAGGVNMTEPETRQELIARAVRRFTDPEVYADVALASTPEAARKIIESLPGVQELIALGPEAGEAVLGLLEQDEAADDDDGDDELYSVALYVLQRAPTEKSVRPLADAISAGRFSGINLHLAADALLTSARVEVVSGDTVAAAIEAAERLK